MRLETYKFIMQNAGRFWYNAADGSGVDNSTDASAATVDPNKYLVPVIGQNKVIQVLVIALLILVIIYFVEKDFFTKTVAAVVSTVQ